MFTSSTKALPGGCAVLVALVLILAVSPAEAIDIDATNCIGGYRNSSCVELWRQGASNPHIRTVPPAGSEQEGAAIRRRVERWQGRCKPVVRQDAYGVERYRYAASGCDFGRLN
jgi:hypothetical protein